MTVDRNHNPHLSNADQTPALSPWLTMPPLSDRLFSPVETEAPTEREATGTPSGWPRIFPGL